MNQTIQRIQALRPDLPPELIRDHLCRLDDRYLETFSPQGIVDHIAALQHISNHHPVEILICAAPGGLTDITVVASDYPSVFSLITGVLTANGLSIICGDVFTFKTPIQLLASPAVRRRALRRRGGSEQSVKRKIVDHFHCRLSTPLSLSEWEQRLRDNMKQVFSDLMQGADGLSRARRQVNEMVAGRLGSMSMDKDIFLLPLQIDIREISQTSTELRVSGQDTPAFLYTLSTALSSQHFSIESVAIRTVDHSVEDTLLIHQSIAQAANRSRIQERIRLAVLLTKQFTCFLGNAPDPFAALNRFEQLIADIVELPEKKEWVHLLSNPRLLQDLARLLGISDFLWEDFIRTQYETLLPMLEPRLTDSRLATETETLRDNMKRLRMSEKHISEKISRLNELKDREIFLIDLDHILHPQKSFRILSERLTTLAELVVGTSVSMIYDELVSRYGRPQTVAELPADYAVFGLGKLGGAALGYASDIELLLVYSDNGTTSGPRHISNAEFFNRMVKQSTLAIHAKRQGIFTIDLRLRPYGKDGPLAVSMENFCRYYGPGGDAHSYERLALVRLRAIGGSDELGGRIERLRDEYVYASRLIKPREIRQLRQRQFTEKNISGLLNAKYSPGGLVDIEYAVQLMQVMHGEAHPQIRTPRISEALQELDRIGVLSSSESWYLAAAYDFFRHLINGLRMLRGSAQDLFLPKTESLEFSHLARRMGYQQTEALSPAQQLHMDFETHSAVVRRFVEHHFGRESLPGDSIANVADIVLAHTLSEDEYAHTLKKAGFVNISRAYANLRALTAKGQSRQSFARLAVLAVDMLKAKPDMDMALNNWERFVSSLQDPDNHFDTLLSQPMRLDILLSIFATSQFLTDTLVKYPSFMEWVTHPTLIHHARDAGHITRELETLSQQHQDQHQWLNSFRKFRRREILRIATRDVCLKAPMDEVTADISLVAQTMIQAALNRCWLLLRQSHENIWQKTDPFRHFCILALGKLGGNELNYSSDIDLLAIVDTFDTPAGLDSVKYQNLFSQVMIELQGMLSRHTEEGYAFRVDLRLRPYGRTGKLVYSQDQLIDYYTHAASPWELQALLKVRPIAGVLDIGYQFVDRIKSIIVRTAGRDVMSSISRMRSKAKAYLVGQGFDIKNGSGGIRDIEFMVQGLQLHNLSTYPDLFLGNTLHALDRLLQFKVIDTKIYMQLREDYVFLRRVEHFLQILADRQTHTLPEDEEKLTALAKRLLGPRSSAPQLSTRLNLVLQRTHDAFVRYVESNGEGTEA